MNSEQSSLEELCKDGRIDASLADYLRSCYPSESDGKSEAALTPEPQNERKARKSKDTPKICFPNLAGFCRYLGIGTGELERFGASHPEEYGRILAVFEDEALNSGLSATLVSAYLKKRLGYDSSRQGYTDAAGLQVSFDHDIFEDGE